MRAPMLGLVLLLTACGSSVELAGVDPVAYEGIYLLRRVDDGAIPVDVSTSQLQGHLHRGQLLIDPDSNFWLTLDVFRPGAPGSQYIGRGNAIASSLNTIEFFDRTYSVQWVGTKTDSLMVVENVDGLKLEFSRIGPYKRPG